MYSEQNMMYDSDSVTSLSSSVSSSPRVDGVIFAENVHEWFQLDQPLHPEVQQCSANNKHSDNMQRVNYWFQHSDELPQNYTYIFDPLPGHGESGYSQTSDKCERVKRRRVQTPYQRKAANVRERRRMRTMNKAFDDLRKRLPAFDYEKKLSRIETLKLAMTYISFMKDISEGKDPDSVTLSQCHLDLKKISENIV